MVENYKQYTTWFKLYQDTCKRYNIFPEDRYNIDKKGFAMGFFSMLYVICPKHERDIAIAEAQNREWTTLIKCVLLVCFLLLLWCIFKGKQHMKTWYKVFKKLNIYGHIAVSKNSLTDNEIGFAWFQECFEPETKNWTKKNIICYFWIVIIPMSLAKWLISMWQMTLFYYACLHISLIISIPSMLVFFNFWAPFIK